MSHLIPNHNQTRWKQNYWLRDLIKYISRLLRNQIRCCLGFCNRFICLFDLMNFVNLVFELYWHLGSISWNWEPTWTSSTATTNTSTETRLKSGFQIHTKTRECFYIQLKIVWSHVFLSLKTTAHAHQRTRIGDEVRVSNLLPSSLHPSRAPQSPSIF